MVVDRLGTLVLAGGILLSSATAQVAVAAKSTGPLGGVAHALGVDGATCALDRAENWLKTGGVTTALPVRPPAGGGPVPDFRIASIVGAAVAPNIDIDAISIGLDLIHADNAGVLHPPPPPAIAMLTFSVTPGTAGAFGPVQWEAPAVDGNAADLFSYWVQRGTGGLREGIDLAVDSAESRIFCTPQRGNMDAHDLYMPLYTTTSGWMLAMLMQVEQAFYFSVTSATVPACPAAWWGASAPSGATVLFTTWTGATWTPIRPFVTHAQLGLPASADLDALAVAPLFGVQPSRWMLYSTTTGLPDPIMIYGTAPVLGPFVYQIATPTGNIPVSRRVGLRGGGTDDVDAICALDPEFIGPPPIWSSAFGGPQTSSVPWPFPTTGTVQLGSQRTPLGFLLSLQGCPPVGCTGGPGVLFFNLPGSALPITTLTLFLPPAANLLQLPVPFAQPSPVLGAALDVYWVRADLTLTSLDASYALRMHF